MAEFLSDDEDDDVVIEEEIIFEDVFTETSSDSFKRGNDGRGMGNKQNMRVSNNNEGKALAPPQFSESESGTESEEHEILTITIHDSDADDQKPKMALKDMICYRCKDSNETDCSFKEEKLFKAHIARHIMPKHFSCFLCKRPFLYMKDCLLHEAEIHGIPSDLMILNDKRKDEKDPILGVENTDVDMKCENEMIYNNHFVISKTIYPASGPPLKSIQEAYDRDKSKRKNTNFSAKAIGIHKQKGQEDECELDISRANPDATETPLAKMSSKQIPAKRVAQPRNIVSDNVKRPRKNEESEGSPSKMCHETESS